MPASSTSEVLDFWFADRARARWFVTDPAFDDEIRSGFGELAAAALDGALDGWQIESDGALGLVILLDQFPRNMYRGSPKAFDGDRRARQIATHAIDRQLDLGVSPDRRVFLYLPFEHSESLDDQERSVELFSQWAIAHDEAGRPDADNQLSYAHRHHEIIRRFGRFPHRNAVLGRASTPAELAFLQEPRSSF
jgi:uncharacterized protein (DUF924 family)